MSYSKFSRDGERRIREIVRDEIKIMRVETITAYKNIEAVLGDLEQIET